MTGNPYLNLVNGQITQTTATQTSAGSGDAGKIPALDSTGRLATTMMPVGVTPADKLIVTSENLTAGNLVNIYDNSGTPTARNADASNGRLATGFVLAGTTSPAQATVFFEGTITGLMGLTSGLMYLGVAGGASATPVSTSGYSSQQIGTAISATEIIFQPLTAITLA